MAAARCRGSLPRGRGTRRCCECRAFAGRPPGPSSPAAARRASRRNRPPVPRPQGHSRPRCDVRVLLVQRTELQTPSVSTEPGQADFPWLSSLPRGLEPPGPHRAVPDARLGRSRLPLHQRQTRALPAPRSAATGAEDAVPAEEGGPRGASLVRRSPAPAKQTARADSVSPVGPEGACAPARRAPDPPAPALG
jgi:hypothetical protein